MWRDVDELLGWLDQQPPGDAVRIARLLADRRTTGALRDFADRVVYAETRSTSYAEVCERLGLSRKQVMHAVERVHKAA